MGRYQTEQAIYTQRLAEWLRARLEGSFAVIKGDRVLGTPASFDEAIRLGIRETRGREFLVKRIQPADTIEWMSHIASPTPLA
ncbi:MAG: hypothetical protein R3B68_15000 [Phycisphaerales bacterium]